MKPARGYAAHDKNSELQPYDFERRELGEHDVLVDILYCGVCHSDVHQIRDDWSGSMYPMVPGHEIMGKVTEVGSGVTKHKQGDTVGIGCLIDSCHECPSCHEDLEQFCSAGPFFTYNSFERDGKTVTQGGYSNIIVTNENFVLKVSPKLKLSAAAPLLCAGITTYSPLKRHGIGKGHHVGIIGLGGLGHMAVKLAVSFGAEVTVFTRSKSKVQDAHDLGAHNVVISKSEEAMAAIIGKLDFILDTVSAQHDINLYLPLLQRDGKFVFVGMPNQPLELNIANIILPRREIAGSLIGGIAETQEMLDYCAEHNILPDVEMIKIQDINTAYERMLRSDVKYRFVIDMQSL